MKTPSVDSSTTLLTLEYMMWINTPIMNHVLRRARAVVFLNMFRVEKKREHLIAYTYLAIWPPRILRFEIAYGLLEQIR